MSEDLTANQTLDRIIERFCEIRMADPNVCHIEGETPEQEVQGLKQMIKETLARELAILGIIEHFGDYGDTPAQVERAIRDVTKCPEWELFLKKSPGFQDFKRDLER